MVDLYGGLRGFSNQHLVRVDGPALARCHRPPGLGQTGSDILDRILHRHCRQRLDFDAAGGRYSAVRDGPAVHVVHRYGHHPECGSHDLQQPILAASLYFDHAISSTAGAVREAAAAREAAIAGAQQAFNSARALLQGMLEHLRLEAGAESARMHAFDLGTLVRDAVIEQAATARAAGVALITVPFTRQIWADPNLVSRILSNLISSACSRITFRSDSQAYRPAGSDSGWRHRGAWRN